MRCTFVLLSASLLISCNANSNPNAIKSIDSHILEEKINLTTIRSYEKTLNKDGIELWTFNTENGDVGTKIRKIFIRNYDEVEQNENDCIIRRDLNYPENICSYYVSTYNFLLLKKALQLKSDSLEQKSLYPRDPINKLEKKKIGEATWYVHNEETIGDCPLVRIYETIRDETLISIVIGIGLVSECESVSNAEVDEYFENLNLTINKE